MCAADYAERCVHEHNRRRSTCTVAPESSGSYVQRPPPAPHFMHFMHVLISPLTSVSGRSDEHYVKWCCCAVLLMICQQTHWPFTRFLRFGKSSQRVLKRRVAALQGAAVARVVGAAAVRKPGWINMEVTSPSSHNTGVSIYAV